MAKQDMLINYVHGEECRIAIVADGHLEELYTERASADLHVSNIYRGRVTNVESSIQAAFVDFGESRSGFLHITDLHPRYFPGEAAETTERVGHKTPRRDRPPIQQCLKRGQEILVQVLKEGIGTKGPTLTSYLSIPGRYLVMMPNMERHGVSRKIEDEEKRREMRKILDELDPPEELGFIVRTAGFGRPKSELKRDLNYLLRLWKDIKRRMKSGRGPAELYTESDLVIRTLRDVLTPDVRRIVVDHRIAALRAREFLRIYMPRSSTKVIHHADSMPLFDAFDVERQIQMINQRQVPLDSGGSLVFDQTEALVAIDVNSGKYRDKSDAEATAHRTNQEAVDEIARQLRLRDLGGLLVLDLIDMYKTSHRRDIERRFKEHLKKDRARTKVLRISDLGMLEMTRQRMRPSLKRSVFDECPTCGGIGQVLSSESVVLSMMRRLAVVLSSGKGIRVELTAHPEVLAMLLNRRRKALVALEQASGKTIEFRFDPHLGPDRSELACFDEKGNRIDLDRLPHPSKPKFTEKDEISLADLKELKELDERGFHTDLTEESEKEADPGEADGDGDGTEGEPKKKKRRRRRRRSRRSSNAPSEAGGADQPDAPEAKSEEPAGEQPPASSKSPDENQPPDDGKPTAEGRPPEQDVSPSDTETGGEEPDKPKRRRRRRGGRRRRKSQSNGEGGSTTDESNGTPKTDTNADADTDTKAAPPTSDSSNEDGGEKPPADEEKKSRRSRRGGRSSREHKSKRSAGESASRVGGYEAGPNGNDAS